MNFIETFKQGQLGQNFGITTGLPALDQAINGIQRKMSITVAAAPKVGKTTFADFAYVLSPYLEMERKGKLNDIEWIYFSFEIDRVAKEFKFAAFFMALDHGVYTFTYKGKVYAMCQDYLEGKLRHRDSQCPDGELIKLLPEHIPMVQDVYARRIIPIFGEWSSIGTLLKPGKITLIPLADNPTGMEKLVRAHAKDNGEFITQSYNTTDDRGNQVVRTRQVGYKPHNPNKYTIVVTDHVRKLKKERGFNMKENIDKWLEYSTELRNMCLYTFIHIVHSGRQLANIERLRYAGEYIFPTADDTKDSGNFAEESTVLMSLFNPNDEKYNLTRHFGVEIKNFPDYRSIHITDSRTTDCPVHIQTKMLGNVNMFVPLSI